MTQSVGMWQRRSRSGDVLLGDVWMCCCHFLKRGYDNMQVYLSGVWRLLKESLRLIFNTLTSSLRLLLNISTRAPWRKTASPQGSWESHWATFPTSARACGLLKLQSHASSLPSSLSSSFPLSACTHVTVLLVKHAGVDVFPDRNLQWTVKCGSVYCLACGPHKQSYSQMMFASIHSGTITISLHQALWV